MLFVALFDDDPEQLSVRQDRMDAHLAYLDREKDRILVGGSLREAPDQSARGGLWIIEASDRQEAEKLCHGDPFWTGGLRMSVTVLHWSKAFPDRKTPV